jgi:hypothetical protein
MEMTMFENADKLDARVLVHEMMETAKDNRASYKYSEDEKMMPVAIIVGEKETMVVGLKWKDNREKWAMMKTIGETARARNARVVGLASDTRWVKSDVLCRYYKRPLPDVADLAEFKKWYFALLASVGGELKNLPREVWSEAVMVAAKGPEIGTITQLATYIEGPNDTVLFQPSSADDISASANYTQDLQLLPDWWTQ